MAALQGGILRRRLRSTATDGVKLGHACDDEYLSDDDLETPSQKSKGPFLGGEVSSPSQYETGSESGDETTDGASVFGAGTHTTDLPPSLPPKFNEEAEEAQAQSTDSPSGSKGWYEFDMSVAIALVSPIGNWLTGGDHVKNLLLILLLIFYLHQIIEVPWSLYHLSRPRRRSPQTLPEDPTTEDRYNHIAASELRNLELFYLALSVLSPVIGAILLRSVIISVSGPDSISWFSTSLFILATGMRPWKHAIGRLRQRTVDLHDVIHYPPSATQDTRSQVEALAERLAQLEAELKASKETMKRLSEEVFDHVDDAVEEAEKIARKQDRKIETARLSQEARFVQLERSVESLLDKHDISSKGLTLDTTFSRAGLLLSAVTEQFAPVLSTLTRPESQPKSPRSPKLGRTRPSSKLETIPEGDIFRTKNASATFKPILVPGIHLVLRIGDLATLPVRAIIRYLLSGRIYQPRIPANSPP
ncbi:hypothetical protein BJ138DRAFT_1149640 [Hygrophoropsis aurantiaca]|uniref:Uncharacterized protein n=1 Tax=Hygrophoropsis aurantiaca TaxID=72124 RepID=A0ACB8AFF1_9AGAM|nr:hypothetical protein BJ138DRAFT_1149640 [Hygrophoropsis aurantiaca]